MSKSAESRLRFSVVIPAYNEADELPVTLAALAAQDFTGGYELVVVDNASTDATAAAARAGGARVVLEARPGVCAARQCGTATARGEIVVSTDADTLPTPGWLTRIDVQFRAHPEAVAVAGPCRYLDPPWWVALVSPAWFAGIAALAAVTGRVGYLTATNVAFRRDGFPGYDSRLTQGGDEVDLLRRLRRWGPVRWDAGNPVLTSSRRLDQGLGYTLLVSYGWYYLAGIHTHRPPIAPAIRRADGAAVARRRRRWAVGTVAALALGLGLRFRGGTGPRSWRGTRKVI